MSVVKKACPVVLRGDDAKGPILAFRHPLAGRQLVKGTIESGETAEQAALRELFEESGVRAVAIAHLGVLPVGEADQEWHFVRCRTDVLPESWTHRTEDDGGLDFTFFWHPLDETPGGAWHPIFRQALAFIVRRLRIE